MSEDNSTLSGNIVTLGENTDATFKFTAIDDQNPIKIVLNEDKKVKKRISRWGADPPKSISELSTAIKININDDAALIEGDEQKMDNSAAFSAAIDTNTDALLVDNIISDSNKFPIIRNSDSDEPLPLKKRSKKDKLSYTVIETVRSDRLRLRSHDSCNIISAEGELIRIIPIEPIIPELPAMISTTGNRIFLNYFVYITAFLLNNYMYS